ncbi:MULTISPECIES: extracellular solute-binding protein [unclassified Paenibacillus]|uniref:ABC transporter substrate-binding protein n=1 Tax=unclassified Paenibacillus TaxID=185978 RepID=UPI001AE15FC1|nr:MULTISPECIES: extracellular solute-binding protein [unclassified Paenibacillus]MBP1157299.1 multiple sugar transport system substrate-binding protein [Paenibacillus sp. PvP091]MBP1171962.1 multiple sugar transport system substrate-binding protein [Paenibacillus sp. PvR098]MBP2438343.1 multiple sugar transport system substrate-binding protein [Paenibacillus sp. PvP052]
MKAKWGVLLTLIFMMITTGCLGSRLNTTAPDQGLTQAPRPTIRVLYATNEAGSEAVIAAAEKYELKTGIHIEVSTLPYNNLQEKVFSELAQRSGYYDLMAVDTPWMPKIIKHLEPMGAYIQNTKSPYTIQLDDFIAKVFLDTSVYKKDSPQQEPPPLNTISLEAITSAGFDVWSLPIQSNVLTVSYRKDLFDDPQYKDEFQKVYNRELTIPQTLEEYLAIAKFFTRDTDYDGKPDLYGTTLMGSKHEANFVDFKSFLSVYGGQIFDEKLKPVFHNEKGVQALKTYGDWIHLHKVTPPDVLDYTWDEVPIVFGFGQSAMGMNYHNMKLDPRVKGGQVGYFMFPGVKVDGTLVRGPHFGSWGIAINQYSLRKQEAYELAEYLTGPNTQKEYLQFNQHVTRKSAYEASRKVSDATLREYYQVLGNSLSVGVGRPRITNYDEVSEAVQAAIHDYLTGRKDAKTALTEGAGRVEALMKQAGYYD